MKVVVGLGNPGAHYVSTRHNIGFRAVEAFAAAHRISLDSAGPARIGRGRYASEDVWVAQPLTFMNRSGAAVRKVLDQAGVGVESLVVVHDDLDLPLGCLRFRRRGGPGGHNGIRSLIEVLETGEFLRLKLGVGRPPEGKDPAEYLLEAFPSAETAAVGAMIDRACEALGFLLAEGVTAAMNRFHADNL